jgi:hypothetical protein
VRAPERARSPAPGARLSNPLTQFSRGRTRFQVVTTYGRAGRGPTKLILPFSAFTTYRDSSTRIRLRNRRMRVTRVVRCGPLRVARLVDRSRSRAQAQSRAGRPACRARLQRAADGRTGRCITACFFEA